MTSVIILRYNDDVHLVPKPADYATLISVSRAKFPELHEVNNDSIGFHFTPEWFNSEVKLDRDAFAEVHNRAVLRITTTATVSAQRPSHSDSIQAGDLADSDPDDVPLDGKMRLCVVHVLSDRKTWFKMMPQTNLYKLMDRVSTMLGVDRDDYKLYYLNEVVKDYDTPESRGMEDLDLVEMRGAAWVTALKTP